MTALVIAFTVAAVVTFLETDQEFNLPLGEKGTGKLALLVAAFAVVNGALAAVLMLIAQEQQWLPANLKSWLTGLMVGAGYLSLVRAKLMTLKIGSETIHLGFEAIYELGRNFVHRRILRSIHRHNQTLISELAIQSAVSTLVSQARARNLAADHNPNSQAERKWLEDLENNAQMTDEQKRFFLATYIILGRIH